MYNTTVCFIGWLCVWTWLLRLLALLLACFSHLTSQYIMLAVVELCMASCFVAPSLGPTELSYSEVKAVSAKLTWKVSQLLIYARYSRQLFVSIIRLSMKAFYPAMKAA